MTNTSNRPPLSLAAQAVMVAATMGNPNLINDPVYRQCIAAALRTAADRVPDHQMSAHWLHAIADSLDPPHPAANQPTN